MKRLLLALAAIVTLAIMAAPARAADCTDNGWQPTFVHDTDRPDGPHYVAPGPSFVKLTGATGAQWVPQACQLIQRSGLRDRRGFTTCQDYTRVQCGCNRRGSMGNSTCAAFLRGRP
ncbi:MAG: hypothetical protein QOI12_785 [Alphaproteobacteria bacterium]|jgi:hypothetical protein|nr:hypothetical protein [Alphaproteobacteria bacterium]